MECVPGGSEQAGQETTPFVLGTIEMNGVYVNKVQSSIDKMDRLLTA